MEELNKTKSVSNKTVILVVVVAVVMVLVGSLAAYFFQSKPDGSKNTANLNSAIDSSPKIDYSGFQDDVTKDGKLAFKRPTAWNYVNQAANGEGFGPSSCDYFNSAAQNSKPCFAVRVLTSEFKHLTEYYSEPLAEITKDNVLLEGKEVRRYISKVSNSDTVNFIYEYEFVLNGKTVVLYGEDSSSELNSSVTQQFEKIVASIVLK